MSTYAKDLYYNIPLRANLKRLIPSDPKRGDRDRESGLFTFSAIFEEGDDRSERETRAEASAGKRFPTSYRAILSSARPEARVTACIRTPSPVTSIRRVTASNRRASDCDVGPDRGTQVDTLSLYIT